MQDIQSYGYSVCFEKNDFKKLSAHLKKEKYSSIFILCDENTLQHCLPLLVTKCPALSVAEIIEIESGEQSKNLDICALIWQTLLEHNADKNTLVINLGGGVVSDLGGFAASVFKRGIPFVNVPTSLLAMADASVGGKTALDFSGLKNVIGSFAQPKAVFIYPDFLKTLSNRHIKNGLAEIYKIALTSDKNFWKKIESLPHDELIYQSVQLKNKIVIKDPFDKGIRKILNFGHTIGHAIEALKISKGIDMLHGEAIVAGMLVENYLALQKKLITKKESDEIVSRFTSVFNIPSIDDLSLSELMSCMANDKKSSSANGIKKLSFSLVTKIGTCKTELPATSSQIEKAIAAYKKLSND